MTCEEFKKALVKLCTEVLPKEERKDLFKKVDAHKKGCSACEKYAEKHVLEMANGGW